MRQPRIQSETGWYHVVLRGAGRRAIFESDEDRQSFLDLVRIMSNKDNVGIAAWALMDNHAHFVLNANIGDLSSGMHRLCTTYASNFNRKNGHVGPVFQGRFASFPINSDEYLMEAIRYVHLNCKDKGVGDPKKYKWCSYKLYITGESDPSLSRVVVEVFGGLEAFTAFHDMQIELAIDDGPRHRRRLNDDEARRIAQNALGRAFAESVPMLDKEKKARALRELYALGISSRQIERLTGIGRGVVRKACEL